MRIRSYVTHYWSTDPKKYLLGGVRESRSSRWGSKSDAENYLETVKENNGSHCQGRIVESTRDPEIFPHCPGHPAQAIGGRCPGCGKVLTKKDAQEFADRKIQENT